MAVTSDQVWSSCGLCQQPLPVLAPTWLPSLQTPPDLHFLLSEKSTNLNAASQG